jgi:hypothetical protein
MYLRVFVQVSTCLSTAKDLQQAHSTASGGGVSCLFECHGPSAASPDVVFICVKMLCRLPQLSPISTRSTLCTLTLSATTCCWTILPREAAAPSTMYWPSLPLHPIRAAEATGAAGRQSMLCWQILVMP